MTLKVEVMEWLHNHLQGQWLWVSRSRDRDRKFQLSPLDSLTPKTYTWLISQNNSVGKTKIQGGCNTPLAVNVGRNSLVVGELTSLFMNDRCRKYLLHCSIVHFLDLYSTVTFMWNANEFNKNCRKTYNKMTRDFSQSYDRFKNDQHVAWILYGLFSIKEPSAGFLTGSGWLWKPFLSGSQQWRVHMRRGDDSARLTQHRAQLHSFPWLKNENRNKVEFNGFLCVQSGAGQARFAVEWGPRCTTETTNLLCWSAAYKHLTDLLSPETPAILETSESAVIGEAAIRSNQGNDTVVYVISMGLISISIVYVIFISIVYAISISMKLIYMSLVYVILTLGRPGELIQPPGVFPL